MHTFPKDTKENHFLRPGRDSFHAENPAVTVPLSVPEAVAAPSALEEVSAGILLRACFTCPANLTLGGWAVIC